MKAVIHTIKSFLRIALIFIILVGIVLACEEPFMPEIDNKYADVLVVDGMITSDSGSYTIQLSRSSSLTQPRFSPVTGYQVIIVDDLGNSAICSEIEAGIYQSSSGAMKGIPGRSYKLTLQSPKGKYYESDFEKLINPVEIEAVYPELEYTQINDYPYNLPGYQFYLDAALAPDDSTYFMWYLKETFQYESDFKIYFSYYDKILHPVQNKDTLKTCWRSDEVNGFFLMSTAALTIPKVTHYPLNYVPTNNRHLSVRYSLLTEQFVMTAKAYKYWKNTIEQNTESGELYTRQLFQVRGNIHNPNDASESVFGYFMAAGISRSRIFVNQPEYPVEMYYDKCVLIPNDYEMYGWMFLGPPPPADNPLFVTENAAGTRALPGQACLNCLLKGGTTNKPDFWIDN